MTESTPMQKNKKRIICTTLNLVQTRTSKYTSKKETNFMAQKVLQIILTDIEKNKLDEIAKTLNLSKREVLATFLASFPLVPFHEGLINFTDIYPEIHNVRLRRENALMVLIPSVTHFDVLGNVYETITTFKGTKCWGTASGFLEVEQNGEWVFIDFSDLRTRLIDSYIRSQNKERKD